MRRMSEACVRLGIALLKKGVYFVSSSAKGSDGAKQAERSKRLLSQTKPERAKARRVALRLSKIDEREHLAE